MGTPVATGGSTPVATQRSTPVATRSTSAASSCFRPLGSSDSWNDSCALEMRKMVFDLFEGLEKGQDVKPVVKTWAAAVKANGDRDAVVDAVFSLAKKLVVNGNARCDAYKSDPEKAVGDAMLWVCATNTKPACSSKVRKFIADFTFTTTLASGLGIQMDEALDKGCKLKSFVPTISDCIRFAAFLVREAKTVDKWGSDVLGIAASDLHAAFLEHYQMFNALYLFLYFGFEEQRDLPEPALLYSFKKDSTGKVIGINVPSKLPTKNPNWRSDAHRDTINWAINAVRNKKLRDDVLMSVALTLMAFLAAEFKDDITKSEEQSLVEELYKNRTQVAFALEIAAEFFTIFMEDVCKSPEKGKAKDLFDILRNWLLGFYDIACANESDTKHYNALKKVRGAACADFKPVVKNLVKQGMQACSDPRTTRSQSL